MRGTDLNRLEFSFAHGGDTLLQKRQRTPQGAHGKSRDQTAQQHHDGAHQNRFRRVKSVVPHVPKNDQPTIHRNSSTVKRENLDDNERKLAGFISSTFSMVPFPTANHHWKLTLVLC